MTNRTRIIVSCLVILLSGAIHKADAQNHVLPGIEIQAYPTGFIPGVSLDVPLSNKSYVHTRLGLNLFDHRDLGVQDEEEGSGFGFSLAYRRFFSDNLKGWRIGVRSDLWFNSVDWKSTDNTGSEVTGNTKITVLQPTAEFSYVINSGNYIIAPSVSLGVEWNVKTKGRNTGEGAIVLVGVQLARKM